MSEYMKKPCIHCPFRSDVEPFLTPERGAQLAYSAENPYNSFPCHKTTEYNEDTEDMECTGQTKECPGFLTLQINEGKDVPEGFEPSYDIIYQDAFEMSMAYEDE